MNPTLLKRISTYVMLCGFVLTIPTGIAIGILIFNSPKHPTTYVATALISGAAAVIFGVVGNFYRFRFDAQLKKVAPQTEGVPEDATSAESL